MCDLPDKSEDWILFSRALTNFVMRAVFLVLETVSVTRYFPLSVSKQGSPLLQIKFTLRDGPSAHYLDENSMKQCVTK